MPSSAKRKNCQQHHIRRATIPLESGSSHCSVALHCVKPLYLAYKHYYNYIHCDFYSNLWQEQKIIYNLEPLLEDIPSNWSAYSSMRSFVSKKQRSEKASKENKSMRETIIWSAYYSQTFWRAKCCSWSLSSFYQSFCAPEHVAFFFLLWCFSLLAFSIDLWELIHSTFDLKTKPFYTWRNEAFNDR